MVFFRALKCVSFLSDVECCFFVLFCCRRGRVCVRKQHLPFFRFALCVCVCRALPQLLDLLLFLFVFVDCVYTCLHTTGSADLDVSLGLWSPVFLCVLFRGLQGVPYVRVLRLSAVSNSIVCTKCSKHETTSPSLSCLQLVGGAWFLPRCGRGPGARTWQMAMLSPARAVAAVTFLAFASPSTTPGLGSRGVC